ncbi:hypothetical protein IHE45_10G009200 [Dioscorea alata]|uniref:Uncharacterized protein n=1 Tax=Dioscorea alata TaxID=55571 RepID=A0ACB7V9I5_DIOAL|nr:hypothetical protein IHE45_10G009200 [Dioscorea alata]
MKAKDKDLKRNLLDFSGFLLGLQEKKKISQELIAFLKRPLVFRNAQLAEEEEVKKPKRIKAVGQPSSGETSSKGDGVLKFI